MRVMLLMNARDGDEQRDPAELAEAYAAVGRFNDELIKAGVLLAAEGLSPASEARRLTFGGDGETRLLDGPFAEAKEVLGGFAIWQVSSMEEAIEWAKRAPASMLANTTVELRRLVDASDFEGKLPPEQLEAMEAENRLLAENDRPEAAVAAAPERVVEAVWRIESARLIAGLARHRARRRPGRGSRAGRARGGARAMAAQRGARQPGRLADGRRPAPLRSTGCGAHGRSSARSRSSAASSTRPPTRPSSSCGDASRTTCCG